MARTGHLNCPKGHSIPPDCHPHPINCGRDLGGARGWGGHRSVGGQELGIACFYSLSTLRLLLPAYLLLSSHFISIIKRLSQPARLFILLILLLPG